MLRLTLQTDARHVEPLTELLEKFGAESVSYLPLTDEDLFDEPSEQTHLWERTEVVALLDHETDMDILLSCVRNQIGTEHIFGHDIELLQACNWTEKYKEDFGVMVFAGALCICPTWIDPPARYRHVISMDPGLAFGTGKHPTTSLCLEWLASHGLSGTTVIDYGCGSGVLALAAARLGADRVYAIDIDPQAVTAARNNAARNRLEDKISITTATDVVLPVADILVANILLTPLLEFALKFSMLVKPGGDIVLSGILANQAEECLASYSQWFKMSEPLFLDEWAILHGVRIVD